MTRITFGLYRRGVREPGITLSATVSSYIRPRPSRVRRGRSGASTARTATQPRTRSTGRSRAATTGGPAARRRHRDGRAIRQSFDVYRQIAGADTRPAFTCGLSRSLDVPPDELVVYIDVVLIDPRGYVPRIVLWTADLADGRAVLYAAPVWRVIEDKLGDGRIPEVEVSASSRRHPARYRRDHGRSYAHGRRARRAPPEHVAASRGRVTLAST